MKTSRLAIAIIGVVFTLGSHAQDCKHLDKEIVEIVNSTISNSLAMIQYEYLLEDVGDSCVLQKGAILRNIGTIQLALNDNEKALSSFEDALFYFLQSKDPNYIGSAYNMIGKYYSNDDRIDSALIYFNLALESYQVESKPKYLAIAYQNLSAEYYYADSTAKSRKYVQLLRDYAIKNSSEIDLTIAAEIELLLQLEEEGVSDSTVIRFHQLLSDFKRLGDTESVITCYENLGVSFEEYGSLDSAIFYYSKASELASDSLTSIEHLGWINDKIIDLSLVSTRKTTLRNYWLIGLSVALFLAFITFLYVLKIRKQNSKIKDQVIDKMISDQESNSMEYMLNGREAERKRIAEELHDRLGGLISSVKLHYSSMEQDVRALNVKSEKHYEQVEMLLDETAKEVRRISHDLHSGILSEFGLIAALKEFASTLKQLDKPKFNWEFNDESVRLDGTIEINLYRIVQESVANILKHADASEVTIQVYSEPNFLNLIIEDDGVGFDQKSLSEKDGIGLKNIAARVERLSGKLNIDSRKGRGTIINVEIPITR